MHWDYDAFITGLQALHLYLECSHPKLSHDNIIEALNNDGNNSLTGTSITILIYSNFYNITQHG